MCDQIEVSILKFYTDRPFRLTGSHLRGNLMRLFPDNQSIHNHCEGSNYKAPDVRYLVVNSLPHIVYLGRDENLLESIFASVDHLEAREDQFSIVGRELYRLPLNFQIGVRLDSYRSYTPWLALNQKNHQQYLSMKSVDDRRALLEAILIGNMLSTLRNCDIIIDSSSRIQVSILNFNEKSIKVRDNTYLGFYVEFVSNVQWPVWLGIGKMASKGFGLMKSLTKQNCFDLPSADTPFS